MTTQPKAIVLAEQNERVAGIHHEMPAYAPELRRQHAEIERLQSQLNLAQCEAKMLHDETNAMHAEIERLTDEIKTERRLSFRAQVERLEAVNAGLVEVCRQVDAHYSGSLDHQPFYVAMARVAISKAAG